MKFSTKMRGMRLSLTAIIAMLSLMSFGQNEGQNLVPNGGFESVEKKPKRLGSIESATSWYSPTGVRADLFGDSKVEDIQVPMNIYGKESPKEGGNYAGIVAFSYGNKLPRSYILTKLESPMKKGMRYCVKFYVSLAEASKYACNNVGVKFSKKPFGTDSKVSIIEEPSLMHFNNDHNILSARYNWTEICGQYVAEGGEKFITLGNFMSDEETKSERMKKDPSVKVSQTIAAYYYIDDISVVLLGEDENCECEFDDGGQDFSKLIYQKVYKMDEDMTSEEKIELQQVYFAFGKRKLTTEGKQSLDLIAEELKANPSYKVELIAHNNAAEDSVGVENDVYADMDLKRVGIVMEYLQDKGIEESRIIYSTKGSEEPNSKEIVEEDDIELVQAKNRRVEFKVRK